MKSGFRHRNLYQPYPSSDKASLKFQPLFSSYSQFLSRSFSFISTVQSCSFRYSISFLFLLFSFVLLFTIYFLSSVLIRIILLRQSISAQHNQMARLPPYGSPANQFTSSLSLLLFSAVNKVTQRPLFQSVKDAC